MAQKHTKPQVFRRFEGFWGPMSERAIGPSTYLLEMGFLVVTKHLESGFSLVFWIKICQKNLPQKQTDANVI